MENKISRRKLFSFLPSMAAVVFVPSSFAQSYTPRQRMVISYELLKGFYPAYLTGSPYGGDSDVNCLLPSIGIGSEIPLLPFGWFKIVKQLHNYRAFEIEYLGPCGEYVLLAEIESRNGR